MREADLHHLVGRDSRTGHPGSAMTDVSTSADDQAALAELLDEQDAPEPVRELVLNAARMAKNSQRHHVVPAGYLDAWTDGNKLQVWNTLTGDVFAPSPAQVCADNDFYTTQLLTGEQSRFMEGVFAVLDDRYIHQVRDVVDSEQLPTGREERFQLASALAFQEFRTPQRRRMMNALAEQLARTATGSELEKRGLDPYRIVADVGAGFHMDITGKVATQAAVDFAMRDWTLHVASSDWFATGDVPVLYDYEAAPDTSTLRSHPSGRDLLMQTFMAGADPADLGSGPMTADQVWVPLAPHVLLEMGPSRTEGSRTVKAHGPVRDEVERLLVRCREQMIIGRPDQRMMQDRDGVTVPRRRQLHVRCVRTDPDGACTMRNAYVYDAEPRIELCGNHY